MQVKKLIDADIPCFLDLVAEIFSDYPIPIRWTPRDFEHDVRENSLRLEDSLVLVEGERMIGFVLVGVRKDRARIDAMGVLPAHRGLGAAEVLLEQIVDSLSWKKIQSITLEVLEQEERAVRFYRKKGFSPKRLLTAYSFPLPYDRAPLFRFEPSKAPVVAQWALRAQELFQRAPNWQREPITIQMSEDRYQMALIIPANQKHGVAGYLVYGSNDHNAFIVDFCLTDSFFDVQEVFKDALLFLRHQTSKTSGVITGLPQEDILTPLIHKLDATPLFTQWEMELRIR